MLIGYARISTSEQSLNLQIDALKKEGCNKIFSDIASGAKTERKGLNEALNFLRKGDTLLVWRLDRLGRTVKHLIDTLNWLEEQGIGFKSLHENIDTISPTGKLVTNIFMALAEFERNLIRERTKAGLEAARARGKSGGRPKLLSPAEADNLRKLFEAGNNTTTELCKLFNISSTTLYKYVNNDSYGLPQPENKAEPK